MKVTIGIITYRRPQMLEKCLKAVRNQTVKPEEIIIIRGRIKDLGAKLKQVLKDENLQGKLSKNGYDLRRCLAGIKLLPRLRQPFRMWCHHENLPSKFFD